MYMLSFITWQWPKSTIYAYVDRAVFDVRQLKFYGTVILDTWVWFLWVPPIIGYTNYVYGVTIEQKVQRPREPTAHYLTKKNSSSEKKMQIVKVIDATQENAATSFPMILGTDWWESVAKIGAIPIKITQLILFLNLYN